MWTLGILIIFSYCTLAIAQEDSVECAYLDFNNLEDWQLVNCPDLPDSIMFEVLSTTDPDLSEIDFEESRQQVLGAKTPGQYCNELLVSVNVFDDSKIYMEYFVKQVQPEPKIAKIEMQEGGEMMTEFEFQLLNKWGFVNNNVDLGDIENVKFRIHANLQNEDDLFLLKNFNVYKVESDQEECIDDPIPPPVPSSSPSPSTSPTTEETESETDPTENPPVSPDSEEKNNETLWMILAIIFMALFTISLALIIINCVRNRYLATKPSVRRTESRSPIVSTQPMPKIPRLYVKNEINSPVITGVPTGTHLPNYNKFK